MGPSDSIDLPEVTTQRLGQRDAAAGLRELRRGIEKESLRVALDGALATTPHPASLGSALSHPAITTDFSEAQLELITQVHSSPEACLNELEDIHRFVYAGLPAGELLWPSSMPCILGDDEKIPLGRYGSSNVGTAKTVYRRGLGHRYGRLMQTISGIHYNFSLPESLWLTLGLHDQEARSAAYFGLIRNFRRWSWLLIYLFGASPSVCRSFTRNNPNHGLTPFDEGSLHLPYATSLRMGPLGYQSDAQASLHISYNSLAEYASSMREALTTEYAPYEQYGLEVNGEYQQLNTAILQSENEFYGTIRPKRPVRASERPLTALQQRGVEYVEVRCLDLNPFLRVGLDTHQVRFIDTFLLLCLLAHSAPDSPEEIERLNDNQMRVVQRGRDPALTLRTAQSREEPLADWAAALLDACERLAAILDAAHGGDAYSYTIEQQRNKVADPDLTPSARVLQIMRDQSIPFFRFTMNQAVAHQGYFIDHPLRQRQQATFEAVAQTSLAEQAELEASQTESFAQYLQRYLAID